MPILIESGRHSVYSEGNDVAPGKPATAKKRTAVKRQAIAVTLRGSEAWKKWIEDGAKHCRTDVAKMIDKAVVEYLKAQGFTQPAPDR